MSSSVGRNSLIMATGTAASRLTGQIRTILLAAAVGTTGLAANAYQAGAMIPQVVFTLVSGGIFNAVLVPQIVRTFKQEGAERKLNKLITFAVTLLLGMTLLMSAASPLLTRLYTDSGPDMTALTNAFTLWCMPQILFYGLYTVIGQILAASNRFGMYAWSSVGANIVSSIGFVAFIVLFGKADQQPLSFWTESRLALTAGAWTLGVAFQALILFLPLSRIGIRYRPVWGIKGIGLRSMGPVAAWSLGIVGVDQLTSIVNTRVINSAPAVAKALLGLSEFRVAGNATYQNAYTLYILPYSLIAVSVATAIFPKISRAIADHDLDTARFDLSDALRSVGLLMCFFTVAFIVMPTPITLALLPSISMHEARLIAGPLVMLAISLPMASAYLIIQRTFYAFEDGVRPFLFILLQAGLQVIVLVIGQRFISPIHWVDLLGASITIAYLIAFPVLVWMLRRRFGGRMDGRRILMSYAKSAIATAAALVGGLWMRIPAYALVGGLDQAQTMSRRWLGALTVCVVLTATITILYVGVLWLLRTDELVVLMQKVTHRVRPRRTNLPPHHTGGETLPSAAASLAPQGDEDGQPALSPVASTEVSELPITSVPDRTATVTGVAQPPTIPAGPRPEAVIDAAARPDPAVAASAIPMDRISGTSHTPIHGARHGVEGTMKPELGEIVINRYTLMTLIREEPGLQAWRAHDRVLSQDCQLFLVNDADALPQINDVASALVLSRNTNVTEVLQLRRHEGTMVIVTGLDHGDSLSAYLEHHIRPLEHEAIRSILGQSARTMQQLLLKGLRTPALSTDTLRLTAHGVELADIPISPLLAERSGAKPGIGTEQLAIRQLSSVLYAMLTNNPSTQRLEYAMADLPIDTPDELRLLCRRGLELEDDGQPAVPMVTLAEFTALLGEWTPFDRLRDRDFIQGLDDQGRPSIAFAQVGKNSDASQNTPVTPFDLDDTLLSTEAELTAREAAQAASIAATDGDTTDANAAGANAAGAATPGTAEANGIRSGLGASRAQIASWWERRKAENGQSDDDTSSDLGFRDIAAAEMAVIMSPTVPSNDDDLPFPEFPSTNATPAGADATGPAVFDFNTPHAATQPHAAPVAAPEAVEATGRIPVIDRSGRVVRPGEESLRALKAEQAQRDATLPPSFTPRPHESDGDYHGSDGQSTSTAPLFGGAMTKIIAIAVVAVVLVAALTLALRGLTNHGGGAGQNGTSQWPNANLDNVPFGDQTQNTTTDTKKTAKPTASPSATDKHEQASPSPSKPTVMTADKHSKKVPAPRVPTNTTPFDIDKQDFLTNPGGQRGYGYHMHLSQPQDVYRFVVKIRSSGGKGYLRANTTGDPNQGEQVAEFGFDASGTTDVKLSKTIKAQDFVLWVPVDSLPNNQLYINSVQFF